MKTYQVRSNGSYYVLSANDTSSATMYCGSWFSFRAETMVDGKKFLFNSTNCLGLQLQMLSGTDVAATSSTGWNMCTNMHFGKRQYVLKNRSWYSADFVLLNEQQLPVMILHPRGSFKNNYDISVNEAFTPEEILFTVYNCNHLKSASSAALVSVIVVVLALPSFNGAFHVLK
ncbi:hypothetical protein [Chitinophaga vietnamensis]|uniref:hypothetical protein n=1 Tax=Chitinophaga vietnamensis TaxID=2593957 RepID=UPI0011781AC5|nr:hypothetical protein [Chitinophaga vietnamensis]